MAGSRVVFVLAHPDDEVLFWPLIARTDRDRLSLVYVTDGSAGGAHSPAARAGETRRSLATLSIPPDAIFFLGQGNGITDGALHTQINKAWDRLTAWVDSGPDISAIYTHAWEGGHQDHDCCHALSLALARHASVERVGQVACYRKPDTGPAPFSVLDPIAANGPLDDFVMTAAERRAMASSIWRYPSQWRSFVGLGPPLLTRLTLSAKYPLQPVSPMRLKERPHPNALLYELRSKVGFKDVSAGIARL